MLLRWQVQNNDREGSRMDRLWPIITVVGPILLAVVLIWAILKNRKAGSKRRSEQGASDLYDREYKDDRRAEAQKNNPPA
jgi:hypothetical protein